MAMTALDRVIQERPDLSIALRTIQIIVAALSAGVITFLAIVFFIRPPDQSSFQAPGEGVILMWVGLVLGLLLIGLRFVIPNVIERSALASATDRARYAMTTGDETSNGGVELALFSVFQTRTIVAGSLLEGAAFLNVTMYLIEGHAISIFMAVVCIAGIVLAFPTASSVAAWMEPHLRTMREELRKRK
jgi:hypothetical protein